MIAHDHDYLTVREAASLLRVSVPTIRRWIAVGRVQVDRLGPRSMRIQRSSLSAMGGGRDGHARESVSGEASERNERVAHVERLIAEFADVNQAILARRGGRPLPSSVPLIRQARRARAEHL